MAKKDRYIYEWPRPMVTVDAVVFAVSAGKTEVLLIQRKDEPFRGQWAVPGGFVEMDEELEDAVARELAEETALTDVRLEQLRTFGKCGRDPRGRQISVAFTGTITEGRDRVRAGDDAAEVQWFDIRNLPESLAFDHKDMIRVGIERLGWTGMYC